MSTLVSINELSEKFGIKVSRLRDWMKKKIICPMSKKREDGKTFLFHAECEGIKIEVLEALYIEFSIKELGKKYPTVFGRRNVHLIDELNKNQNRKAIIDKFVQKVRECTES